MQSQEEDAWRYRAVEKFFEKVLRRVTEWEDSFNAMIKNGVQVNISNGGFSRKSARKFLALNGMLLIGPRKAAAGDILCHKAGSEQEFFIVKYYSRDNSFAVRGPAILLKRKQPGDPAVDI